jgi:hypothetical protein
MRAMVSALVFALVGLTPHLAVANDGFAVSVFSPWIYGQGKGRKRE